jgi:rSAM/selenodomain-associated transferase 2
MISVVIPTLNAEQHLGRTLAALVPAVVDGLVKEVVLADGGSTDGTLRIADHAGVEVVTSSPGRGAQMKAGADQARHRYLLFLHADTVLEPSWITDAYDHLQRIDDGRRKDSAAAFRFVLDDEGIAPRVVEWGVAARGRLFGLPYGDQGLLISRSLYKQVGGFSNQPLMEDVDIVRKIGRSRIVHLPAKATTSADRYRRDGYAQRTIKNFFCLALYFAGLPPTRIARVYGSPTTTPEINAGSGGSD